MGPIDSRVLGQINDQRGGFATIRLCAHHVTLPDRSRGATDSGLFKSEQSSNGSRLMAVTRYSKDTVGRREQAKLEELRRVDWPT